MSIALIIRSNASTVADVLIRDLGFTVTLGGGSVTVTDEEQRLRASASDDLRTLATDDAYGVGSSTLILNDGVNDVAQADVEVFLSNLTQDRSNTPYGLFGVDASGSPTPGATGPTGPTGPGGGPKIGRAHV